MLRLHLDDENNKTILLTSSSRLISKTCVPLCSAAVGIYSFHFSILQAADVSHQPLLLLLLLSHPAVCFQSFCSEFPLHQQCLQQGNRHKDRLIKHPHAVNVLALGYEYTVGYTTALCVPFLGDVCF